MTSKVTGVGDAVVKKNIDIFIYKEWHLSIDIKTKVVQHAESEWMRVRHWESEIVWEWESDFWAWKQKLFSMTRVCEWENVRVSNGP